ncbi:MAG: hypothetical protein ABMA25_18055 [Ilumatobacteraceae bacterium]
MLRAQRRAERPSISSRTQQNAATVPVPAAAPQVIVVIHQPGDNSTGTGNGGTVAAGGTVTAGGTVAAGGNTASQPVLLTAQPVVRQAPAAQAPAAKSNGSR